MMMRGIPFLFCLVVLVVVKDVVLGTKDSELKRCKHQCKALQQIAEHQRAECYEMCEKYHREKQEEEEKIWSFFPYTGRKEGEEYGEQKWGNNPYVFEDQHFITGFKTQNGKVRVLPKFTERSKLLKGIENYRFAFLEANPKTFVVPNHWDADAVLFVAQGRGTLNWVRKGKRNSFNIRPGYIIRVHAGTTAYFINRENDENLLIPKLLRPISTPGQFEQFFGPGGRENPESFYSAFSSEVLEAALDTRKDRLQRLFGQQREGVIIRASEELIRVMSRHEEGGIWPFGGESKGSINIFRKRPSQSNQYGKFYEVDESNYGQLADLDISLSFSNISEGVMSGPIYSSRATKIAMVVDGEGYFEMACPHSSSKSGTQRQRSEERELKHWLGLPKGAFKVETWDVAGPSSALLRSRPNPSGVKLPLKFVQGLDVNLLIVHRWIVPTEEVSVMTSYINLGHVDTIVDPTVELIKKELAGATAIRRVVTQGQPNVEALHDQPFTKADPGASSGGVVGVGGHCHPSLSSCSRCECDKCKDRQDKLFEKVEAISKAIKQFKSKRCVIPSKKGPVKKVDIYTKLGAEEKRDLRQAKNAKPVPKLVLDEEEMLRYVRRDRPNPHGKSWTEAKRIIAVISVNDMYYRAVEILLEEVKINVYDSNVPFFDDFQSFSRRGATDGAVAYLVEGG
ncbi:Vicilin-like antimicrobial peptides 2-3 [Capsicum baccatum]|uniref:Vicilin-like antimicrobial peptides 2-3 n=1 Tax=Capsicum baccatum TaxID=33114 RepID=A0A2G2VZ60_CAPBA|nr:Vicilin-like antimicrobial peptides 2-3 [Capsicum baccatum]